MAKRDLKSEAAAFYTRVLEQVPAYGASVSERASFQLLKAEGLEYLGIANPANWALLSELANKSRYDAGVISGEFHYLPGGEA